MITKDLDIHIVAKGGLSWGIPYAVGVLCLGQQAGRNLDAFELKDALIETAAENNCIINPYQFIQRVEELSRERQIFVEEIFVIN